MKYKVNIVIEQDEDGYIAYSPELPGCMTQGNTMEELMKNIKEAVELYMETLPRNQRRKLLSKEILTTSLEVSVV